MVFSFSTLMLWVGKAKEKEGKGKELEYKYRNKREKERETRHSLPFEQVVRDQHQSLFNKTRLNNMMLHLLYIELQSMSSLT